MYLSAEGMLVGMVISWEDQPAIVTKKNTEGLNVTLVLRTPEDPLVVVILDRSEEIRIMGTCESLDPAEIFWFEA